MLCVVKLAKILDLLRALAPEHRAESWDQVGLQLGDTDWRVSRAMLCIDLTGPVLAEAIRARAGLVVSYHPPIFQALPRLTGDDPKQRLVLEAARRRIAIYSPHTALDAAEEGVNDWLCGGIGKGRSYVIQPRLHPQDRNYKIICFVPAKHGESVLAAMSATGAGRIGNYVECSYESPGQGTFRGLEGATPFLGRPGRRQRVDELRMEMICADSDLPQAIAALRRAHPYEEPAFDIYRLEPAPDLLDQQPGQGRVLELNVPIAVSTLVRRVKQHLGLKHLEVAIPQPRRDDRRVRVVAVCPGAGGSLLTGDQHADAYVTGEMRHHEVLDAIRNRIVVILAGHTQTERPYLNIYRKRIVAAGGNKVEWRISRADRPPLSRR